MTNVISKDRVDLLLSVLATLTYDEDMTDRAIIREELLKQLSLKK
jgi:transcriptional regulator CtsR